MNKEQVMEEFRDYYKSYNLVELRRAKDYVEKDLEDGGWLDDEEKERTEIKLETLEQMIDELELDEDTDNHYFDEHKDYYLNHYED